MPPQEQADLWMALRDRMKVNWAELTLQEKKAGMLRTPMPNVSLHLQRLFPTLLSPCPAFWLCKRENGAVGLMVSSIRNAKEGFGDYG
jgi:hypothetical protein